MRISKTEEHGVRLVMRLAAHGRQLTVTQLAELENLPEPTVAKVLLLLRRGGIVRAERGRHGGYSLSTSPSRISVGQVLESLGKPLFEGRFCYGVEVPDDRGCPREDGCGLRSVWRHIEMMVMRVLFGTSLNDLLHGEESVEAHVGDLWPLRTGSGSGRLSTIELKERARQGMRPAYKES
jgi:Rrf2 family transcriptional regulator, iron-sulfur cluster assembly transcription factor